ncbi:MAG: ArnT family glycosyltransferase [Vicinamibacterales bacterium]
MTSPEKTTRLIVAAVAVGVFVRLAFALFYWQNKPLTHDEGEYLSLGLNMAAGRGFSADIPGVLVNPSAERFSRAPFYPAFIAAIAWLTQASTDQLPASVPRALQIVQSLLGSATIALGSLIAREFAGRRVGVMAAWLLALYPPLIWTCAYALSEALYTPLALLATWLVSASLDRRDAAAVPTNVAPIAWAGAVLGVAALTRPAALVFVALASAGLLVWRRAWAHAIVLPVVALLVIAPWTIRNYAVHHRFVAIAAEGGVTFWTGNHPLAIGEGDLAANPALKRAQVAFRERFAGQTPEAVEPFYYQDAWHYITTHPGATTWLVLKKFFYTWVPIGPSYRLHSPLYYGTTLLAYLPMLAVATAGLWLAARSLRPPRALLLLAASSVIVGLIFFPQERFRLAVIDPTLCILAAARLGVRHHE